MVLTVVWFLTSLCTNILTEGHKHKDPWLSGHFEPFSDSRMWHLFLGPPEAFPGAFDTVTNSRCGWRGQGKGEVGLAVPLLILACVCVCSTCIFWLQGRETCVEDFDLWGSEHDDYDLPSKKLTSALRTSKHLFHFCYIIRPKAFDGCVTNTNSYSSLLSEASKLPLGADFSCRH